MFAAYGADGRFIGYAIPGEAAGFQDTIKLLLGFDPARRRVVGMQVLESRETPGLGDKIYKDASFVANFADLAVEDQLIVEVKAAKTSLTRRPLPSRSFAQEEHGRPGPPLSNQLEP